MWRSRCCCFVQANRETALSHHLDSIASLDKQTTCLGTCFEGLAQVGPRERQPLPCPSP